MSSQEMPQHILHFTDKGKGEPLLILHGLFGAGDNWNQIAKALPDDFRTIQVDLRNHGRSFHSQDMSYAIMAEDIKAVLTHLAIPSAHILGHSMGGKVAMELSQLYPQLCKSLTIVDIAPRQYQPNHNDVFKGLNAVDLSSITNRNDAEQVLTQYLSDKIVAQFLLKSLYREDGKFKWRFNLADLEAHYQNLIAPPSFIKPFTGPVMFIKGMNSNYIEASDRDKILEMFPMAQSRVISDTGHWPHAEKPRILLKIVEHFLSKQD